MHLELSLTSPLGPLAFPPPGLPILWSLCCLPTHHVHTHNCTRLSGPSAYPTTPFSGAPGLGWTSKEMH